MEVIAHKYLAMSEAEASALIYLLIAIGFLLALYAVPDRGRRLHRMPYFLLSCVAYLLGILIALPSQYTVDALLNGVFWVVLTVVHVGALLFGLYIGKIAVARGRDAYGNTISAFMAVIPLANLWLLFKPSLSDVLEEAKAKAVHRGVYAAGIALGFMIIGSGKILEDTVTKNIEENNRRIASDDALASKMTEALIGMMTVENALKALATDAVLPQKVDAVTALVAVEADKLTLRRTLDVSTDRFVVTEDFRHLVNNGICSFSPFALLLKKGVTIEDVYVLKSGGEIGSVVTTIQQCDKKPK